jgi:hypothetical protein
MWRNSDVVDAERAGSRLLKQKMRDEWNAKQAINDNESQLAGNWQPNQVVDKWLRTQRLSCLHIHHWTALKKKIQDANAWCKKERWH